MVACRYACINENVKGKDVVKRAKIRIFRDHCGIRVAVKAICQFFPALCVPGTWWDCASGHWVVNGNVCVSSKSGHNYQCKTTKVPFPSQMTFHGMKHNPCQPMMNTNYEGGINKRCFKPLRLGGICYCNITKSLADWNRHNSSWKFNDKI